MLTLDDLAHIFPKAPRELLATHHPHLVKAMAEFGIDTPVRVAAFLGQLGLESGEFKFMEEIASGDAYEGREDLGNVVKGDGRRFKGRGSIQLTGRANYTKATKALGLPLLEQPELAAKPEHAHRIAAWFWQRERLNGLADLGTPEAYARITSKVNGARLVRILEDRSTAHHDRRCAYHAAARKRLGC